MVVILSIVTLGIYGLYWFVVTQDAIHERSGKGFGGIGTLLLSLITCGIYAIYWYCVLGSRMVDCGVEKNRTGLYLLLLIIPFGEYIVTYLLQSDINTIADEE